MFFPSSFIFVHFLSSDMLNFSHLSFDGFLQFMFSSLFDICSGVYCACNNVVV